MSDAAAGERAAWRSQLKSALERAAVLSGVPAVSRLTTRGSTIVLAYHNVAPDGAALGGERSLHLPRATFAAQLDLLRRTHDVVPLAAILTGRPEWRRRPRAVITFDDAYHGALTEGVRELVARGLPATIFVAPHFVGGGSFWWDAVDPGPPADAESFRGRVLDDLEGKDGQARRAADAAGLGSREVADYERCASEELLRSVARQPGITLGSHSWSHPNLARVEVGELREELSRPLQWLRERFDGVLPVISYPYGLWSPAVAREAAAAGYRAGLRIEGGWLRAAPHDLFALPRLNVPAGLSAHGFALRAAGLFCR